MASTNAEVMLYFGVGLDDSGGKEFNESVSKLRFSTEPEMSTLEIIKVIGPIWNLAYDLGHNDGTRE